MRTDESKANGGKAKSLPAVYRGASRFRRVPFAFYSPPAFLVASIILFADHPWIALVAMVSMIATFAALVRSSRIVVGTDGILVEWLGKDRFFARETIKMVAPYEQGVGRSRLHGVAITLQDDTCVKVPLEDERTVGPVLRSARAALGIVESDGVAAATMALARGDRSHEAWLSALRALLTGAGDRFRVAAVSEEDLWAVVANPSASPEERAAAAFALRGRPNDETQKRLLRVATETAEPMLRTILERAAAEGAEAELEQAMIEFDQERAKIDA